mmetsp:Transcript_831/g.891  ORF Transcript_831/g.891 Transcript_831/m.891 type:complete len:318 (-) Transcript_831:75-1028(-)
MAMEASKVVQRLLNARPVNLPGHKNRINTVAWSSNGSYLATGSDSNLKVFTVETDGYCKEVASFTGHTEAITSCCWNPKNNNELVTCAVDNDVRFWDVGKKKCAKVITTKGDNLNITWSLDGKYIVAGNRDDVLTLIDAKERKIVSESSISYEINELCFDVSGAFLFAASGIGGVGRVEVFRIKNNKLLRQTELVGHTSSCYCAKVDKTGMLMASAGTDSLVNLWDLQNLVCTKTFAHLDHPIRALSMSHDSKIIAYGSENGVIAFGSVDTGAHLGGLDLGGGLNSIAWNPTKHMVAYSSAGRDPVIQVIGVNFKSK